MGKGLRYAAGGLTALPSQQHRHRSPASESPSSTSVGAQRVVTAPGGEKTCL